MRYTLPMIKFLPLLFLSACAFTQAEIDALNAVTPAHCRAVGVKVPDGAEVVGKVTGGSSGTFGDVRKECGNDTFTAAGCTIDGQVYVATLWGPKADFWFRNEDFAQEIPRFKSLSQATGECPRKGRRTNGTQIESGNRARVDYSRHGLRVHPVSERQQCRFSR